MGWRKLTIQDGDLVRYSDLSATEQVCTENADLGDSQLRQHLREAACLKSSRTACRLSGRRARGRAVTAVCLCSDSRGLGIRTALSKLREMTSRPVPTSSHAHPPGSCMSMIIRVDCATAINFNSPNIVCDALEFQYLPIGDSKTLLHFVPIIRLRE